jgi:DNA-directed RNA polymerase II subunit RPB1
LGSSGDEMNLHIPRMATSKYEAKYIMNVKKQFINPQSNKPCMGSIMDTSLGLRMFVSKDVLLTKIQVYDLLVNITTFNGILPKPVDQTNQLWDGMQIFSIILPNVNYYEKDDDGSIKTLIKNGKFKKGIVSKRMVGTGSRGLVHIINNDFGPDATIDFFNNIQQLICNWFKTIGFSIGICDVIPDVYTNRKIQYNIKKAQSNVHDIINEMSDKIHINTADIVKADFESKVIQTLNITRDTSGAIASKNLPDTNSIKQMVSISKGSFINVSQITASVGQQNVTHDKSSGRVPNSFDDRSLPHFPKYDFTPESRGFIANSYYTGLTAQEFFFHAMAGREGIIDTAIKTAETGYIQRQLIKIMEDVVTDYDMTCRNESNQIIEYIHGGDGMNPCHIERQPVPKYLTDMEVFKTTFEVVEDGKVINQTEMEKLYELKKIYEEQYSQNEHISLPVNVPRIIKNYTGQLLKTDLVCDLDEDTVFDLVSQFCDDMRLFPKRELDILTDITNSATMLFRIIVHMEFSYKRVLKHKISYNSLLDIFEYMKDKFYRALISPGSAVGVTTGQGLGEPCMQLTLNAFHSAGIASKTQMTSGVVRIKEVITLSKNQKNSSLTIYFTGDKTEDEIHVLKNQFDFTAFSDVIVQSKIFFDEDIMDSSIEQDKDWLKEDYSMYNEDDCEDTDYSMYVIRVELDSYEMFTRSLTMRYIYKQLMKAHAKKNLHIMFTDDNAEKQYLYIRTQKNIAIADFQGMLPELYSTIICGITNIDRTFTRKLMSKKFIEGTYVDHVDYVVDTEGSNFEEVIGLPDVDSNRTYTDNIIEIIETLGIFAGANALKIELKKVMQSSGIIIDNRHYDLLARVMTSSGTFLPINRHGSKKSTKGVLSRCSFEETSDQLTKGAIYGEVDNMVGASANIIMAQLPPIGAGKCEIALDMDKLTGKNQNKNNNNDNKTNITMPVMFDFERTKLLGIRIGQLENGAPTTIKRFNLKPTDKYITENIALKELELHLIPLKIVRLLNNNTKEYWKTEDFLVV